MLNAFLQHEHFDSEQSGKHTQPMPNELRQVQIHCTASMIALHIAQRKSKARRCIPWGFLLGLSLEAFSWGLFLTVWRAICSVCQKRVQIHIEEPLQLAAQQAQHAQRTAEFKHHHQQRRLDKTLPLCFPRPALQL